MQSPRPVRRALLIAVLALTAAACGRDETPAGVIPRERFIAANVALRSLPDSATPEQRTAALRKHGVTERQLKAWINGHVRQPETLAKAYEEIAFKLDSLGGSPPSVPSIGGPAPQVPPARPRPAAVNLDTTGVRLPPPPPPSGPAPAGRPSRRPTARIQ